MKNIAILIVGQLRLPDLENLYNSIKNFDIYISTYDEFYEQAKLLTNNIIITNKNDQCFNKKSIPYNNIYQWWHLNN